MFQLSDDHKHEAPLVGTFPIVEVVFLDGRHLHEAKLLNGCVVRTV